MFENYKEIEITASGTIEVKNENEIPRIFRIFANKTRERIVEIKIEDSLVFLYCEKYYLKYFWKEQLKLLLLEASKKNEWTFIYYSRKYLENWIFTKEELQNILKRFFEKDYSIFISYPFESYYRGIFNKKDLENLNKEN